MTLPVHTDTAPDPAAVLSASWFGAGLPPDAIARLAAIADVRDLAPGDTITTEGQIAETLGVRV